MAQNSIELGQNVDVVGFGDLAYKVFMDYQGKKKGESTELDQVNRFVRALVLELRVVINLLDLAEKAEGAGDATGSNGLLCEIEYPLLQAVAMGLNDVPFSREGAEAIVRGIYAAEEPDDDGNRPADSDNASNDVVDQLSRMVSRLLTVQAIARVGNLDIEIKWNVRLRKLRREAVDVLKSVLANVGEADEYSTM